MILLPDFKILEFHIANTLASPQISRYRAILELDLEIDNLPDEIATDARSHSPPHQPEYIGNASGTGIALTVANCTDLLSHLTQRIIQNRLHTSLPILIRSKFEGRSVALL